MHQRGADTASVFSIRVVVGADVAGSVYQDPIGDTSFDRTDVISSHAEQAGMWLVVFTNTPSAMRLRAHGVISSYIEQVEKR